MNVREVADAICKEVFPKLSGYDRRLLARLLMLEAIASSAPDPLPPLAGEGASRKAAELDEAALRPKGEKPAPARVSREIPPCPHIGASTPIWEREAEATHKHNRLGLK